MGSKTKETVLLIVKAFEGGSMHSQRPEEFRPITISLLARKLGHSANQ